MNPDVLTEMDDASEEQKQWAAIEHLNSRVTDLEEECCGDLERRVSRLEQPAAEDGQPERRLKPWYVVDGRDVYESYASGARRLVGPVGSPEVEEKCYEPVGKYAIGVDKSTGEDYTARALMSRCPKCGAYTALEVEVAKPEDAPVEPAEYKPLPTNATNVPRPMTPAERKADQTRYARPEDAPSGEAEWIDETCEICATGSPVMPTTVKMCSACLFERDAAKKDGHER